MRSKYCDVCGEKMSLNTRYNNNMYPLTDNGSKHVDCAKKHGKKTDFTCGGCGETIAKKITKRVLKEGVIETVCPGCGVSVEIAVSSVSVQDGGSSGWF